MKNKILSLAKVSPQILFGKKCERFQKEIAEKILKTFGIAVTTSVGSHSKPNSAIVYNPVRGQRQLMDFAPTITYTLTIYSSNICGPRIGNMLEKVLPILQELTSEIGLTPTFIQKNENGNCIELGFPSWVTSTELWLLEHPQS